MVKHIRMIAAACTAAILTLVGCSNIGDDATVLSSGGTGAVEFSVANNSGIRAEMAPDALSKDTLYYKISGESSNGTKYPANGTPTAVTFDEEGKFSITGIIVDDWNFTLYAYSDSGYETLVLQGTSSCAVKSSGKNSVAFTLSSYGVSTKGGYSITIKYNGSTHAWDADNYNLEWALYNKTTGELLNNTATGTATAPNAPTIEQSKVVDTTTTPAGTGYVAAQTSGVTPGTYIFRIRVKSGNTEIATKIDELVVEPGRVTTKDFTFGDNIKIRPAAPATLQAQFLTDGAYKPEGNFYTVRLYWPTSTSQNEDSYELIVKEFTNTNVEWKTYAEDASTAIANDSAEVYGFDDILTLTNSTVATATDFIAKNTFNIGYAGGSLYAGNSELYLTVPTGRLFDFQIRAKNNIGESVSVARSTSVTTPASSELASSTSTTTIALTQLADFACNVEGFAVGDKDSYFQHVGVTQIKYALNGGYLYTIDASSLFGGDTYVEYKIYNKKLATYSDTMTETAMDEAFIPLMTINPTVTGNTTYPKLTKGPSDNVIQFNSWSYFSNNVSKTVTHNINGYEDILVTAQFGSTTSTVTLTKDSGITIETRPTISATAIKIYVGENNPNANTTEYDTTKGISVKRGSKTQYITVAVTTATDFTKYALWVNGVRLQEKPYQATQVTFANFATTDLNSGVENYIMVEGITANGYSASASATIKLTN